MRSVKVHHPIVIYRQGYHNNTVIGWQMVAYAFNGFAADLIFDTYDAKHTWPSRKFPTKYGMIDLIWCKPSCTYTEIIGLRKYTHSSHVIVLGSTSGCHRTYTVNQYLRMLQARGIGWFPAPVEYKTG